jgi:hypothetical protein
MRRMTTQEGVRGGVAICDVVVIIG